MAARRVFDTCVVPYGIPPSCLLALLTRKQLGQQPRSNIKQTSNEKEHPLLPAKMPCILKTVHSSGHHTKHPFCTRSMADNENPGIVAKSSLDAAAIAMMVIFFALLGTAIVLVAVYCSKRALDKECERADKIQLTSLPHPTYTGKASEASSNRTVSTRSTLSSKVELPRFQTERHRSGGPTIRDRRGMSELSVMYRNDIDSELPRFPPPTHRSEPSAVFPGVQYGMRQIGNDGRVHRPESIFEHLRP